MGAGNMMGLGLIGVFRVASVLSCVNPHFDLRSRPSLSPAHFPPFHPLPTFSPLFVFAWVDVFKTCLWSCVADPCTLGDRVSLARRALCVPARSDLFQSAMMRYNNYVRLLTQK